MDDDPFRAGAKRGKSKTMTADYLVANLPLFEGLVASPRFIWIMGRLARNMGRLARNSVRLARHERRLARHARKRHRRCSDQFDPITAACPRCGALRSQVEEGTR